ncbi:MAG: hypothetical protein RIS47_2290 [Bacteroidota bacterium]
MHRITQVCVVFCITFLFRLLGSPWLFHSESARYWQAEGLATGPHGRRPSNLIAEPDYGLGLKCKYGV